MDSRPFTRRQKRQRLTVSLPTETIERMRDAVYWTPGTTIASLISNAVNDLVRQLESMRGEPFSTRLEELKPGRPKGGFDNRTAVSEPIQGYNKTDTYSLSA